jgi:predicted ArsR family transcriptional regulator
MPPSTEPAAQRSRAHGALASTSRIQILTLLRSRGTALEVAQIATHTGLHPNTVRFHLRILTDAGLACCRTDPRGGAGRPRLVYTAASDGSPHPDGFHLLADILTSYLATSSAVPAGLAEEAGQAFARRHQQAVADVPADAALGQMTAMYAELGFEPELVADGQDMQLRLRACPFAALAGKYPEVVCAMHLGLLRGTLHQLGAPVTARRLRPFVEPHLCIAHLEPPPTRTPRGEGQALRGDGGGCEMGDECAAERREIAGIAAGDQVAVGDDFLVDDRAAGVADVGADTGVAGQGPPRTTSASTSVHGP